GTHQSTLIRDQHDLLTVDHLHRADQRTIAFVGDHGDDTLTTPLVLRELLHRGALAVAVFRGGQNLRTLPGNQHGHQTLPFGQAHTAHTAGGTAHRPDVGLLETGHLAAVGEQHDLLAAIGQGSADQDVALVQIQRDQTNTALTTELRQRGLLHGAVGGGHEHVPALGVLLYRQHGGDELALFQRQQVDQRPAAGGTRGLGDLVGL